MYRVILFITVNIVTLVLYMSAAGANKEGKLYANTAIYHAMRQVLTDMHVNFHFISAAEDNVMDVWNNVGIFYCA